MIIDLVTLNLSEIYIYKHQKWSERSFRTPPIRSLKLKNSVINVVSKKSSTIKYNAMLHGSRQSVGKNHLRSRQYQRSVRQSPRGIKKKKRKKSSSKTPRRSFTLDYSKTHWPKPKSREISGDLNHWKNKIERGNRVKREKEDRPDRIPPAGNAVTRLLVRYLFVILLFSLFTCNN